MLNSLFIFCKNLGRRIKQWSKPTTATLVTASLTDMARSKTDLIAENALLRQQLIVLNRQVKRPQFTPGDRLRLMFLARCTRFWQRALHIIQPDTLLRWHRNLFRLYWRYKSRPKNREPRISRETIDLIKQMAQENRLWGAERIRGELLKLGIEVSKRTIQKYMSHVRTSPSGSQTWATFLKNHAREIWGCDFTTTYDLFFRPIHIFVIIELHSRRIVHVAVTRSPTDEWVTQQLREATPWGKHPRFLIHDRDSKYGSLFLDFIRHSGIQSVPTPVRTPQANGYTSYCTSFVPSDINLVSGNRRRSASFRPWSLVGASGPGGSNR